MFDLDKWGEIIGTMRKNLMRTILTAMTVAWGIFLLVILVAAGNGLQNGIQYNFRDDAINSLWVYPGKASLPHRGMPVGRRIQFTNDDYEDIRRTIEQVEHITSRFYLSGNFTISYKNEASSFEVRACHPDHVYLENTIMVRGRFVNDIDIDENRKVTAIGTQVVQMLFKDSDPIGEWINVNGIMYKVVGIFRDEGGPGEERKIYIPISTAQQAYGGGNRVNQIMLTIGDTGLEESEEIAQSIRELLAERHNFAPNDQRAVFVRNNLVQMQNFAAIVDTVKIFLSVMAIMTIIAGVIGVSNIMLITVKERTREFGVRKALGATPGSIVSMILQESVVLTALSGYIGLVLGVFVIELANTYLPPHDYFRTPTVDVSLGLIATVIVIVAGALAGLWPAIRAARIKPVLALRDE